MSGADADRSALRAPMVVIGFTLIGLLVLTALLAPWIAAHDPEAISGLALEEPSAAHRLGTDVPGRDLLAQVVFGARSSLVVALLAGSLAMVGAIAIGVVPALLGGLADAVATRAVIFVLALPGLPLVILVASFASSSRISIIAIIAVIGMAPNARILRSQALSLRQRGYVAASRGFGGGPLHILRRHLVPGLAPLIVVGFVNWAGVAIGLEAGLAFLGLGDPSGVSWGLMLNRALSEQSLYFSPLWVWWVLPAGLGITVAVLGFTLVGVGLEPVFNPRWLRTA